MEAALDEVRFLAEHGKIKYKVRKEIFWEPYLPKFTGYLEIQEFDNEVRGISKYMGQYFVIFLNSMRYLSYCCEFMGGYMSNLLC